MLELTPFYEAIFPPTDKPIAEMADDDSTLAEVVLKRRLSALTSVNEPESQCINRTITVPRDPLSIDNNDNNVDNDDNDEYEDDDELGTRDVKRLKLESDSANFGPETTFPATVSASNAGVPIPVTPNQLSSTLTVNKTLSVNNYVNQNIISNEQPYSGQDNGPLYAHHSLQQQRSQQSQEHHLTGSAITNCEQQTTIQFSPNSYSSSESFSDDDDDDEDDSDEDDDDDDDDDDEDDDDDDEEDDIIEIDLEEVELAHENSFNSTGMASTESESGYDERSSSEGSNESESFELGSILPSGTTFTATLNDQQPHQQQQQQQQHQHSQHQAHQLQTHLQHAQQQSPNGLSLPMPADSNSPVFCSYTPPATYYVGSTIHAHTQQQPIGGAGQCSSLSRPHQHLHAQSVLPLPLPQPPPPPPPQPSESQLALQKKQAIFSICLQKLQRYRQCSDSSLVKSVLVCNTLRALERDFKRAGVELNFGPNGVQFNSSPVIDSPVADLDILPGPQPAMQQQQHHQQLPSLPPPPPPPTTTTTTTPPLPTCSNFVCPPTGHCPSQTTPTESELASDANNNCETTTPANTPTADGSAFSDPQQQQQQQPKPVSDISVSGHHHHHHHHHPALSRTPDEFNAQAGNSTTNGSLCNTFWPDPEDEARLDSLSWSPDFGVSPAPSQQQQQQQQQQSQTQQQSSTVSTSSTTVPVDVTDMISSSYSSPLTVPSTVDDSSTVCGTFATLLPSGQTSGDGSLTGTLLESTSYAFNGTNTTTSTVTNVITSTSSFIPYSGGPTSGGSDEIFADIDMSLYDFDLFGNTLAPPPVSSSPKTIVSTPLTSTVSGSEDELVTLCSSQNLVTMDITESSSPDVSTKRKNSTEGMLGVTPCV